MNRQNVILALGLLLVLANGIASGEIQSLWHDVTGLSAAATNANQGGQPLPTEQGPPNSPQYGVPNAPGLGISGK